MIKKKYLIIAFETTSNAIYAEKIFKNNNCDGRIIPLPKAVNAGCGLCWASKNQLNFEYWKKFMEENNIKYQKLTEVIF